MGQHLCDLTIGIDAVDSFHVAAITILDFQAAARAVTGVGEINAALGVNSQIVGTCVTFSLKMVCQYGDRAVGFGSRNPPVSLWSRTFAGE